MIKLRWSPTQGADIAAYKIYRSIVGFIAPKHPDLDGCTLDVVVDGGSIQSIEFDDTDVVDKINAGIEGARAYNSLSVSDYFLFRSNTREAPGSVEILGGDCLALLGLTERLITERSETHLLDTVMVDSGDLPELMCYEDKDGTPHDYYAISTVDSAGNESAKTNLKKAVTSVGGLCVVEGLISNAQGGREVDVEVSAKLADYPSSAGGESYITKELVKTLTYPDGRFSMSLVQGAVVKIEIPEIGYFRTIRVPEASHALILNELEDLSWRYPVEYK